MKTNLTNISLTGIISAVAGLLLVIAVIIIAVWIHNRKNKKTEPAKLPKDTDWGKELTDTESADVQRIAKALYDDMKGFSLVHNKDPYKEMIQLSDKNFVAVANQFAAINGNSETLTQWLKDEVWYDGIFRTYAKNIIERLEKLGAK